MDGWVGMWAGRCARRRQALLCALPLISLLVLIWIATCGREWIHSCTQSTTTVIGCSVDWQPPYVPEQLCRGYNNKPLWEVANKNNRDKSTSYHNLVLWKLENYPPHPHILWAFLHFPPIFLHSLHLRPSPLASVFLVHPNNKYTFSSCQPSKGNSPSQGGVRAAWFFHLPFLPYSFFSFFLLPDSCHSLIACPSVSAANNKRKHVATPLTPVWKYIIF